MPITSLSASCEESGPVPPQRMALDSARCEQHWRASEVSGRARGRGLVSRAPVRFRVVARRRGFGSRARVRFRVARAGEV